MNSSRFLATMIMVTSLSLFGYQSSLAQGMGNPFNSLQTQIDSLTQALVDSAPNSSVEGRTYCSVLTHVRMLGSDSDSTIAQLRYQVVRRTTTFSGGVIDSKFLSNVRNIQDATGAVTNTTPAGIDVLGTYIQTGQKLALM